MAAEDHDVGDEDLDLPDDHSGFQWSDFEDLDDPEAIDTVEEFPVLQEDEYLLVLLGGDTEVVRALPKPRKLQKALGFHSGCLIICEGRRRTVLRTPLLAPEDAEDGEDTVLPLATRIVQVFINHRSSPPRTRSRRYLIVTNENDELLAWIDHSPPGWDFQASMVRALADYAGLESSTERFNVETEFELAHPTWLS